MFGCERKVIGANVADVEQALTEQYGRASLQEKGRSEGTVSYIARLTSRSRALATILPNPDGVTVRLAPYLGPFVAAIYVAMILFGLLIFILPGLIIASFLLFQVWVTGKAVSRHIDNIASGAAHQSKLRARRV